MNLTMINKVINRVRSYWGLYFVYYRNAITLSTFDLNEFSKKIIDYTESLRVGDYSYKFSHSTDSPTLYSSCYACMIRGLLGKINEEEKQGWLDYFDCYQNDDGLFYDPLITKKEEFANGDGWGARHLLPHLLIAYTKLGGVPKKKFNFLEPFENKEKMIEWLNSLNMNEIYSTSNQIMNVLCSMQYARDYMNCQFDESIRCAENWLQNCFNNDTGLWFPYRKMTRNNLNNAIRGSYHIFPIFVYDGISLPTEKTASSIKITQNILGGFDTNLCSSACYDIDGIEPYLRFTKVCEGRVINKAFRWIMSNQNEDGGFVFQRYSPFKYGGDPLMSSKINESNIFATWFRALSIFYILGKIGANSIVFTKTPGYEMPINNVQ